jgi:hypothetical protein
LFGDWREGKYRGERDEEKIAGNAVIIIEDDDICWLVFSVRALIKSDSWLWKINRRWRAPTWGFFLFF